jgi:hypothetical protein
MRELGWAERRKATNEEFNDNLMNVIVYYK